MSQPPSTPPDQAEAMDRMYRFTRHVYDLSRKYYLLGRDRLLDEMELAPGDRVLEVGCGTARNLIVLAGKQPEIVMYGLDASTEMLETAQQSVDKAGLTDRITLRQCLAEQLDHKESFDLDGPFDAIFFSYSLSMIPTWREAIQAALENLPSGKSFYIVDFWDQADLPGWFRGLLTGWLKLFHVQHRPELYDYLKQISAEGQGEFTITSVGKRYALLGRFTKPVTS